MSGKRLYEIAFVGLKPGIHEYEYEITDKFFSERGEQDFSQCKATVKLALDKKSNFMLLKFEVAGSVLVGCDRCGNILPIDLWDEFNTLVKVVEDPEKMNEEEEDPDVYYIGKNDSHLHIADWIYEFINLSIPMQRMCSESEMGGPHCNKEVLEKLQQMKPSVKEETPGGTIWKGLDKFKDLN